MKKILLSLLTIVVVSGAVVGATRAFFRDSKTSTENVLGATTFNVRLAGEDDSGIRRGDMSEEEFFNVTNLVPGNDENPAVAYVDIRNDSNTDMLFRLYAENLSETKSGLRNHINMKVTLNPSGYDATVGGDPYGTVDNVIYEGTLGSIVGSENALDNTDAACVWNENNRWPLKQGMVASYKVELWLDWETPNGYQGESLTSNLQLDAVQFDFEEQCDGSTPNVSW